MSDFINVQHSTIIGGFPVIYCLFFYLHDKAAAGFCFVFWSGLWKI